MWYDNLYGVFHLKGIRINVGYLGANFEINKARTCGIAYCDIFHQKAYVIIFNECALIFNKEEEITLVVHTNTPIYSLNSKQKL